MTKEEQKELIDSIVFDPSTDEILGAIRDEVHIKGRSNKTDKPIILVMSEKEYYRVHKNWMKGKRDYCTRYNSYCGVFGYVFIEKAYIDEERKIQILDDNDNLVDAIIINVIKFDDDHDFECG